MAIQAWENPELVYWAVLIIGIIFISNLSFFWKHKKDLIKAVLVALILSAPVAYVYWEVSHIYHFTRNIRDAAHFSMDLIDPFGKFLSPGMYLLLIFVLHKFKFKKFFLDKKIIWLTAIIVVAGIFALGPVVKYGGVTVKLFGKAPIPLPYTILYYLVPGFDAMRTTSRWFVLVGWGISGLIAYAFKGYKFSNKYFLYILLFGLAIIGGTRLTQVSEVPKITEVPEVYRFLKNQSGKVVLELPLYSWTDENGDSLSAERLYYSLYHKKYLVDGYSGFTPLSRQSLQYSLRHDTPDVWEKQIVDLGTDYIMVHKSDIGNYVENLKNWERTKLIWQNKDTWIFEL